MASPSQESVPDPGLDTQEFVPDSGHDDHATAFEKVYRNGTWRMLPWTPASGTGSSESHTRGYRDMLTEFIKEHNIKSVVDYGCGDWTFSQLIDWTGIDYLGVDVVQSVVDANNEQHGGDGIEFRRSDLSALSKRENIKKADLWIVKDVFQHWSIPDIEFFLKTTSEHNAYTYLLFTNCITDGNNVEIKPGDFRHLNHQKEPFSKYFPIDVYSYHGFGTLTAYGGQGKTSSIITKQPGFDWTYQVDNKYPAIVHVALSMFGSWP